MRDRRVLPCGRLCDARRAGRRVWLARRLEAVDEALELAFSTLKPLSERGPAMHRGYRLYIHNERVQVRLGLSTGAGGRRAAGAGNACHSERTVPWRPLEP